MILCYNYCLLMSAISELNIQNHHQSHEGSSSGRREPINPVNAVFAAIELGAALARDHFRVRERGQRSHAGDFIRRLIDAEMQSLAPLMS